MVLDLEAWQDLDWWHTVLQANIHHMANVADTTTAGVLWGDSSGTNMGGMLQLMSQQAGPCPPMHGDVDGWVDGHHCLQFFFLLERTLHHPPLLRATGDIWSALPPRGVLLC